MSTTKKRDLSQELVDFLLKEEGKGGKTISLENSGEKKTALVEQQKTSALQKTYALQSPTGILQPIEGGPSQRNDKKTQPVVEFDLDLGDGPLPEVDFHELSKKSEHVLSNPFEEDKIEVPKKLTVVPVKQTALKADSNPSRTSQRQAEALPTALQHGQQGARSQAIFSEVNSLLGGVNAVHVAQARILTLEKERDVLRIENDKLLSASESLKKRVDELNASAENQERRHTERVEILEEEKTIIRERLSSREKELVQLKKAHEDYQNRFLTDLRKVRVRERDLENRQEILKAETAAVIRVKDEMILELKRQLEQLEFEINGFRSQSVDLNATITEFYERNSRTVKALRLALSVLEMGDEERVKKAGGSSR